MVITHRIHGTGIFTYNYHRSQTLVCKHTIHGSYGLHYQPKHKAILKNLNHLKSPKCDHRLFLHQVWSSQNRFSLMTLDKKKTSFLGAPSHASNATAHKMFGGSSPFGGHGKRPQELRSLNPKKNRLTFHHTGWLIGILIMAYYIWLQSLYSWVVQYPINRKQLGFCSVLSWINEASCLLNNLVGEESRCPGAKNKITANDKPRLLKGSMGTTVYICYTWMVHFLW